MALSLVLLAGMLQIPLALVAQPCSDEGIPRGNRPAAPAAQVARELIEHHADFVQQPEAASHLLDRQLLTLLERQDPPERHHQNIMRDPWFGIGAGRRIGLSTLRSLPNDPPGPGARLEACFDMAPIAGRHAASSCATLIMRVEIHGQLRVGWRVMDVIAADGSSLMQALLR